MSQHHDVIDFLRKPRAMPSRRATKFMLLVSVAATLIAVAVYPTENPLPSSPAPFAGAAVPQ